MKEKWVQICQIQGFEEIRSCYWISNSDKDKIINRDTEKQLKIGPNSKGYPRVRLMTIGGKVRDCRIHAIKASAFLFSPNPLAYNVVRHLNDIKCDNRLINLAWGSLSDNMKDCVRNGSHPYANVIKGRVKGGATTAKKVSKPVRCIETGVVYPSALQAEHKLGITRGSISHCCSGKRKIAKGFHWEFVDKEVSSNELECKQI